MTTGGESSVSFPGCTTRAHGEDPPPWRHAGIGRVKQEARSSTIGQTKMPFNMHPPSSTHTFGDGFAPCTTTPDALHQTLGTVANTASSQGGVESTVATLHRVKA